MSTITALTDGAVRATSPTSPAPVRGNVAALALAHMRARPDHPALIVPTEWDDERVHRLDRCTYGELGAAVTWWRWRLATAEVTEGHRVLMLASLGIDFYAAALAVLASGCTLVLVDRGMSIGRIRWSVATAAPDAVVLSPALQRLSRLVPETRRITRVVMVDEGPRPWRDGPASSAPVAPAVHRGPDDEAIVTFTSGSTGRPKGADRTHGTLVATHQALEAAAPYAPDEVDVSAWPVVVMHALLSGTTSVLPPVTPGRLHEVPAEALLSLAIDEGATQLHGPPAFLGPILRRARQRGARPAFRRVVASGGPVSVELCRNTLEAFPGVDGVVLYGSTEAEPVAYCRMSEVLDADAAGEVTPGSGLLVGPVVDAVDLKILPLASGPAAGTPVSPAGWGEIAFSGDNVMPRFFRNPAADAAARVQLDGRDYLRSGDIGRIDDRGRLWLGGRVADVVVHHGRAVHTYEVEPVLDALPGVVRSAVLQGPGGPEVFIDTDAGRPVPASVQAALAGCGLGDVPVHGPVSIPVDGRHQSKVDRPTLRRQRRRVIARAAAHRLVGTVRSVADVPFVPPVLEDHR